MRITNHDKGHQLQIAFDSIYDFAELAADGDRAPRNEGRDDDTAGTNQDFDQAMDIANSGGYWPEGAQNVRPSAIDLSDVSTHDLQRPRPHAAMAGYMADVPAYLAGSPLSMVNRANDPINNRLINIGVSVGSAWHVKPHQMQNRGKALLSVIDAVENAGFSVRLVAVWKAAIADGKKDTAQFDIMIKDYDRPFDKDSLAFTTGNVDFGRRLVFGAVSGLAYRKTDNTLINRLIKNGMGISAGQVASEYDIFFPSLSSGHTQPTANKAHYDTETKALATVERLFSDHINNQF